MPLLFNQTFISLTLAVPCILHVYRCFSQKWLNVILDLGKTQRTQVQFDSMLASRILRAETVSEDIF